MQGARGTAATVAEKATGDEVDDNYRRTKRARVSPETVSFVGARLDDARPVLEQHFGVQLSGWQDPQFLVYRPGDFFQPHPDRSDETGTPAYVQGRQVSSVLFLNDQADEPRDDSYSGGALTFYGLLGDGSEGQSMGLPLVGKAGLFVAFRSELVHSVTPITHGERYTVVSWFF